MKVRLTDSESLCELQSRCPLSDPDLWPCTLFPMRGTTAPCVPTVSEEEEEEEEEEGGAGAGGASCLSQWRACVYSCLIPHSLQ